MRIRLAPLAIAAIFTATGASAAVVYDQPYDRSGRSFASQNEPNGGGIFATSFDDFSLGTKTTINSVGFTGNFFNGSRVSPSAFAISFYSNNGGQPGALLNSSTVDGAGGETFVGIGEVIPLEAYSYSVPINFVADAGQTYWLSIVPTLDFPPQWGWTTGTGGNGSGFQDSARGRFARGDFAFSLSGNAVPEPESWALLVIGFGALGATLRSRRSRAIAA